LFRTIDYQNVAFGVKKFEEKACRGVARLSEDGGLIASQLLHEMLMGRSKQAAVAAIAYSL
jgi:hypothetical protein